MSTLGLPMGQYVTSEGSPAPSIETSASRWLSLALWASLLVLTTALLVYPRWYHLEYAPIQSIDIFPQLPLFSALYYGWLAAPVWLATRQNGLFRSQQWSALALMAVYALGWRGIWDLPLPDYSPDGLSNIVTVQYIVHSGMITTANSNISYLDFPGLHLLAACLSEIASISATASARAILLSFDVLLAWLLYLVAFSILSRVNLAILSAILAMLGSQIFASFFFYPGYFGLLLILMFSLLLLRSEGELDLRQRTLAVILLGCVTITHLVSAIAFTFLVASVVVLRWILRQVITQTQSVLVYVILPCTWVAYYSITTFPNAVRMAANIAQNIRGEPLFWVGTVARANLGSAQPIWATFVELFWLFSIYGLGGLAVLFLATRLRAHKAAIQLGIALYVSLALLAGLDTAISTGGFEIVRLLIFLPLSGVPLLVKVAAQSPLRERATSIVLAVVLVVMSAPTLLEFHSTAQENVHFDWEYVAAAYLLRAGDRPRAYSLGASVFPLLTTRPDGDYTTEGGLLNVNSTAAAARAEALFERIGHLRQGFQGSPGSVFAWSARPQVYYERLLGIQPSDSHWSDAHDALSTSDSVYDNGFTSFYWAQPR